MIFTLTEVEGVFLIDPERLEDERGFFARTWCEAEFAAHGIQVSMPQCNISFNRRKGTLRGMHYQREPHGEGKLVRCTMGVLLDVMIDLRPDSPTYLKHVSAELSAENRRMLYGPPGCAHGFQTLQDDTEVFYQMTVPYLPEAAAGVRYNDPAFALSWPLPVAEITERDRGWPEYRG